jgi:carbamoyl-phosphate synthase large subunit
VKVLVTGAGALLGQGIIKALKASSLKLHIVAVDPSPLSAGLYWADSAHLISMASSPGYLDRLREVLSLERPDVVLVGTDVELPLLAAARGELESEYDTKVVISRPEVVRIADDKWLTYQFLRDEGLGHVPSCLPGSEEELIIEVGFPLVVKPRVGARSVGLSIVRSRHELDRAIQSQSNIVIQQYVGTDETEYTAGTLTFDGECSASIVMRRDLRDGNTYRAYVDAYPELNRAMKKVAVRLQAYGPANFQFRLVDDEPKIFEINGRFSGTTPLRAHAGFNEVEMSIRHSLYGEAIVQPVIQPLVLLRYWTETVVRPEDLLLSPDSLRGSFVRG